MKKNPPLKELSQACAEGDLKKVNTLLNKDPSLALDWKPIMDASFHGHPEIVSTLIKNGADPNVQSKNSDRHRPLHRTIEYKVTMPKTPGHEAVVDALLQAGADPMLRGSWNKISALALCAAGGTIQFLEKLKAKSPKTHDIFHAALLGEKTRVASLLKKDPSLAKAIDQESFNYVSNGGWTPLKYCVSSKLGKEDKTLKKRLNEIAILLLENGADPSDSMDSAIYDNNPDFLEIMWKYGGRHQDDDTLNHAACSGCFDALDFLAEKGIDLNGTHGMDHHRGYTPLGGAIFMRSVKGAEWFLKKGCDPNNLKGGDRDTGLHAAVRYRAGPKMFDLLLEHGAKPTRKNKDKETPLDLAKRLKNKKAVAFLEAL